VPVYRGGLTPFGRGGACLQGGPILSGGLPVMGVQTGPPPQIRTFGLSIFFGRLNIRSELSLHVLVGVIVPRLVPSPRAWRGPPGRPNGCA